MGCDDSLTGFIPQELVAGPKGLVVRWIRVGDLHFTASFLSRQLAELVERGRPEYRLTPFSALEAVPPPPAPAAFIFHHGRCGSTLMARMLGAPAGHCALSEPAVLGQLLLYRERLTVPLELAARWLINALVARGGGYRALTFIKPSSWCTPFAGALTAGFPGVPRLFLFRDPLPTLASLAAMPAPWFQSPEVLALIGERIVNGEALEERIARVVARLLNTVLGRDAPGFEWVHYDGLKPYVLDELPRRLGIAWGEEVRNAMEGAARWDAHQPDRPFDPDRRPGGVPSAAVRRAHERHTLSPYRGLLAGLAERDSTVCLSEDV